MATLYAPSLSNDVRDVSEIFELIVKESPTLLSMLDTGIATNYKHEWIDDAIAPLEFTINGATLAGVTTVVFDSTTGMRAGDVLIFEDATSEAQISNLQVQIVSVDSATSTTVTRPYAGSTDATITDNAIAKVVSRASGDNDAEAGDTFQATTDYNYTQIFSETAAIGETTAHTNTYDGAGTLEFQIQRALQRIMFQMEKQAIFGIRQAPTATTTGSGKMQGIIEYINVAGGNSVAVGGALAETPINNLTRLILEDGGFPNILVCSPKNKQVISGFTASALHVATTETIAGQNITTYRNDITGGLINVLTVFSFPNDKVVIGDSSSLKLVALQGDAMRSVDATLPGSRQRRERVHGQYTLEVKDAKTRWGVLTGITV